jgi:hypothetical protein
MAYTPASQVRSRRIRWLWKGRLALGYLGVWTGAGDIGKSMFAAWTIGQLSHGELDGELYGAPRAALIIATEDGREDMWKPRLQAVDADLDHVHFFDIPEGGWNLRDGIDVVDGVLDATGAVLVFVDAAMEHMPDARGGENVNSPTFVRGAMGPLRRLSRERNIASLFGLHPPKAKAATFADTVQASGAFSQLSRTGLLFGYHPDDVELPRDDQRRVVIRGKGNAGRNPGALSFAVVERVVKLDDGDSDPIGYVIDVQPSDITERQLLRAERPQARDDDERQPSKVEQVEQIILERLADGEEHPSLEPELLAAGYRKTTIHGARRKLCPTPRKEDGSMDGPWLWRLRREHVVGQTNPNLRTFEASRGGPPSTRRTYEPSRGNPSNEGRFEGSHKTNETSERRVEGSKVRSAGDTPCARDNGQLSEDETVALILDTFPGSVEERSPS